MPPVHPSPTSATVLALHHGYRVAGGEERAAAQLAGLAETHLGERVSWVRRDSTTLAAKDAARGLIVGGIGADQIRGGLAETGATVVHAHNLFPTFGPAALRAARDGGAGVVVHLHNYRLVCAVATTVRDGRDCTECHVRWPVPGVRHRCRGSLPEVVAYAAALPRWQRSVVELADVIVVPSVAARERLEALGLRLPADRVHVVGGVADLPDPAASVADPAGPEHPGPVSTASQGRFALTVTRLAPEKDLRTAIEACALAGLPLVIAGDGPERDALQAHAAATGSAATMPTAAAIPSGHTPPTGSDWATDLLGDELRRLLTEPPVAHGTTVFVGRVGDEALRALRAGARVGLATSVAHETFGLSALESMAAALPTIGSAVGALPELLGAECVVPPGQAAALAERITSLGGRDEIGVAAAARAARLAGPEVVARQLGAAYAAARRRAAAR